MYARAFVVTVLSCLIPGAAAAKSWCAYPLYVHEWGVQVFDGPGRYKGPDLLPSWFFGPGKTSAAKARVPVRELPADNGERDLPVVHFYSPGAGEVDIPVGLEVGFRLGSPTAWYPDVSSLAGAEAPRRQLVWDRLDLTRIPTHPATPTDLGWIHAARTLPSLWLANERTSERFVFYEGRTREQVPLELRRGPAIPAASGYTHLEIHNRGRHDVHDVLFVHRAGHDLFVFSAPKIPAGKSAGFLVEKHRVAPDQQDLHTLKALRASLTDTVTPTPPTDYRWNTDRCVMMRNPAEATTTTASHRLYSAEVDLVLGVWAERFFGKPGVDGTRILYREDTAYLDEFVPMAVYTDMTHFVVLHRASLSLWENVTWP